MFSLPAPLTAAVFVRPRGLFPVGIPRDGAPNPWVSYGKKSVEIKQPTKFAIPCSVPFEQENDERVVLLSEDPLIPFPSLSDTDDDDTMTDLPLSQPEKPKFTCGHINELLELFQYNRQYTRETKAYEKSLSVLARVVSDATYVLNDTSTLSKSFLHEAIPPIENISYELDGDKIQDALEIAALFGTTCKNHLALLHIRRDLFTHLATIQLETVKKLFDLTFTLETLKENLVRRNIPIIYN